MVVRNRSSAARPVRAAQVHMLHPNLDLDEEILNCMRSNVVENPISEAYYDDKIEEYYTRTRIMTNIKRKTSGEH